MATKCYQDKDLWCWPTAHKSKSVYEEVSVSCVQIHSANTTLPTWWLEVSSYGLQYCSSPLWPWPEYHTKSCNFKMEAIIPQAAEKCCWLQVFLWKTGITKSWYCCIMNYQLAVSPSTHSLLPMCITLSMSVSRVTVTVSELVCFPQCVLKSQNLGLSQCLLMQTLSWQHRRSDVTVTRTHIQNAVNIKQAGKKTCSLSLQEAQNTNVNERKLTPSKIKISYIIEVLVIQRTMSYMGHLNTAMGFQQLWLQKSDLHSFTRRTDTEEVRKNRMFYMEASKNAVRFSALQQLLRVAH